MRRPWALPLVPLYAAGLWLQNRLRRPPKRLTRPVISVGSLSAGGAGKTPVVIALAQLLRDHGIPTDVLSRGYGRGSGVVQHVPPDGLATHFGDEPLEMARAGLDVWVAAQRLEAGRASEDLGFLGVHLLDDGFQHRRLARSLDLVLLTLRDVHDHLLPAGNLREPLRALHRADILILRESEAEALAPYTLSKPTLLIRRELILPPDTPLRPLLFCGLARPQNFLHLVQASACQPAGHVFFPDHHPYTPDDCKRLSDAALHTRADGFLTTAKDHARLTPALLALLAEAGPVAVAALRVTFLDPEAAWAALHSAAEAP